MGKEISSMKEDLERLGIIVPVSDAARSDIWEMLFHPSVTEKMRAERTAELKALQERYVGKKVCRNTERGICAGVVLCIKPRSGLNRMYSYAMTKSGWEALLRISKGRGVYIPIDMISLLE